MADHIAPANTADTSQPGPRTPIADERDELMMIHREIDALQVSAAERQKPWYQNSSTTISVIALLFSFSTTYVSNRRIGFQDIQSSHQQLRTISSGCRTLHQP